MTRAAVLGSPIGHSLSPALHRAAYASLGLTSWQYDAIEIRDETELAALLAGLDPAEWGGLSLTMPLKEAALALAASADAHARQVGAANTLLPGDGGWHAVNTDIGGIAAALEEAGAREPRSATVLGAGATARSALSALARLGVREVTVCARRPEAAGALVGLAGELGVTLSPAGFDPDLELLRVDVVVSTVPGDAAAAWAERAVAPSLRGTLLDASYHPWPTPLAAAWQAATGRPAASGRAMLLWQAVEQVHLMTGLAAPVAAMRAALPPG